MEYLVPVLAVVVIGALAAVAGRWMAGRPAQDAEGGRGAAGPTRGGARAGGGAPVGPERARQAAGLLDESAHRAVYGHIAQGRPAEAFTEYRRHTGRSVRDAIADVQSLAAHPQVYVPPMPDDPEPSGAQEVSETPAEEGVPTRPGGGARSAGEPGGVEDAIPGDVEESAVAAPGPRHAHDAADEEPTALTVPDEWLSQEATADQAFEVEVMRGDGSVHLSSADLPAWLRDQLSAMVRDGNLESAAVQLSSHSELSVPEAFDLLRHMRERGEGWGA